MKSTGTRAQPELIDMIEEAGTLVHILAQLSNTDSFTQSDLARSWTRAFWEVIGYPGSKDVEKRSMVS